MLFAQTLEGEQPLPFLFSKCESQLLPIIERAKFVIEFLFRGNKFVDLQQVFVA